MHFEQVIRIIAEVLLSSNADVEGKPKQMLQNIGEIYYAQIWYLSMVMLVSIGIELLSQCLTGWNQMECEKVWVYVMLFWI